MNGLSIYTSSAGSGKTFTLVKEYLKIVLQEPASYRNILAITFTNKASAEMKERIIRELSDLSFGKFTSMRKNIADEIQGLTETQITQNASQALSLILHDYSGFAISTIDSFFYKVIRSVAREMQLPPVNEIEMDTENVISEVIDSLFSELEEQPELSNWLEKMMMSKLNDDKGWKIDDDLRKIASELLKEQFSSQVKVFASGEINKFIKDLNSIKYSFENELRKFGDAGLGIMQRYQVSPEDFTYGKSGVGNVFNKLKNEHGDFSAGPRITAASENQDAWISKSSDKKRVLSSAVEELMPLLKQALKYQENNLVQYITATEVLKNIYIFGITEDLIRNLKRLHEEKRLLLLPDIPQLLHHLISEQDAPFVFEKFGNTFHHFMVDEFQDTSDLQFDNLLPLIRHSLSTGNFVMIVGDAKQSIYRWRSGNVELLLNGVQEKLMAFKKISSLKSLTTNFRSQENIVHFNNKYFSSASKIVAEKLNETAPEGKRLLEKAYSEGEINQSVIESNLGNGFVQFSFIESEATNLEGENSSTWKEKSKQKLIQLLNELKRQNFSGSDIAILVRKNTEGEELVRFLFQNDITNIISPDSLLLRGSEKIRFLLAVFAYLDNPENEIAKTQILHYYQKFILKTENPDTHEVFLSFTGTKNSLFSHQLPDEFTEKLSLLRKLPIYELGEHVVPIFNLGDPPDAYVGRFLELIFDFSRKENTGIRGFLEWWAEHEESDKCSLSNPDNPDAITIMTIHKSKGLQFPVVIIPFLDWEMEPESKRKEIIWATTDNEPYKEYAPLPLQMSTRLENSYFAKDYFKEISLSYLDNLNLLYVAFTRPEQRLYVFSPGENSRKGKGVSALSADVVKRNSWRVNPELNQFESGSCSSPNTKIKPTVEKPEEIKYFISSRWQGKIAIAAQGKKRMDTIPYLNSTEMSSVDFGLLIHDILKDIHTAKDIPHALSVLNFEGSISLNDKQVIKNILDKIVAGTDSSILFSENWNIKTERELLMPDGTILRPDRVLINGNKVIVADYKTGNPSPDHSKQINEYGEALISMGYSDVKKYILYIRKNAEESTLQEVK